MNFYHYSFKTHTHIGQPAKQNTKTRKTSRLNVIEKYKLLLTNGHIQQYKDSGKDAIVALRLKTP